MVCRSRPGGSASTSYAQQRTRLPANAVLSLSHQLRHEGRGAPGPTRSEVRQWAAEAAERVGSDGLSPARQASIIERLNAAAEGELPSGPEFYAWVNIEQLATAAAESINAHLRRVAQRLNLSEEEVRANFAELYARADGRSSGIEVPTEWAERFRSDPDNGLVPGDRGTLYALHELYARAGLSRPLDVRPLRQAVPGTARAVRRVGYDRASGRLELWVHRPQGPQLRSQPRSSPAGLDRQGL